LFVVFAHLLSVFATVLKPGGAKGLVAENLLLRQQLLILRRSRRRAPNLRAKDRLLLGFWSCFVSPRRRVRTAIILSPPASFVSSVHSSNVNIGSFSPQPASASRDRKARLPN